MSRIRHNYIAMQRGKFTPERLIQALGDNPYPTPNHVTENPNNDLMMYSLHTGSLSSAASYLVEKSIIRAHYVESEEEMAGYILANRLGADLRSLFNGE